jgi:uncharacterized membrane protein YgdD (TMEM256/DUF423 family)
MPSLARRWIAIGALLGAIAVALGAFAAHGLEDILTRAGYTGADLHHRLTIFETAVRYQMFHALALVATGLALQTRPCGCWNFAGWAFLLGIILFCAPLKVLTFAGPEWTGLGHVVPFGGASMIAGWIGLAIGAIRARPS